MECFTECCRQLDLALTPYDVLRLKNRLRMHSGTFLERYVIIEWDERVLFPQCYLTMVDDGRESCIFVSPDGCKVYPDRPGACRAYPVGRGVKTLESGMIKELFVLVKEPHCNGFSETILQTPGRYFLDQDLDGYSRFNDMLLSVTQHQQLASGNRPSRVQLDQFLLALYNLDLFRQEFSDGRLSLKRALDASELQGLAGDDEKLLALGIKWLLQELYNE